MDIIKVENLSKIFKNNSGIKDINFSVKKGSFHALIGPNGAGKTTLIRTILGLYQKYGGKILINGINANNKKAYEGIGYISETPVFPNELNVFNFLLWSARFSNKDDNETKVKIEKFSERLGILDFMKSNPNKLSSGQKQKVMLIKILLEDVDIIIMDEPTANLDPSARIMFFNEINELNKKGKTVFISSHNLPEIEDKVDSVTVVKKGQVILSKKKGNQSLTNMFKKYVLDGINE